MKHIKEWWRVMLDNAEEGEYAWVGIGIIVGIPTLLFFVLPLSAIGWVFSLIFWRRDEI